MRGIFSVIVIVYLVGVGVVLLPTIQANWNSATAAELAGKVGQYLPYALAWPARLVRPSDGDRT